MSESNELHNKKKKKKNDADDDDGEDSESEGKVVIDDVDGEDGESEKKVGTDDDYAIIPPNGGWGWVVVFCAFYCNIIVDGMQLTFGIFLKPISNELKAAYSEVALAGSLMFGVHLCMGPVCCGCNHVFGLRPVTITGSLICCFGVGLSYFSNGYWFLYISYGIIGGMGLGLVYMNTLVITSLYFTSLMPVAVAIVVSGTGLGTMVFAVMGNFLLSVTTWRNSFLIQAALAGSMSVAAASFKPLKPIKVKILETDLKPVEKEETDKTSFTSRRRSVYIRTHLPSQFSNRGSLLYQNLALGLAETAGLEDESSKRRCRCECLKYCERKKKAERKNIVVLSELKSDSLRRNSYVEKGTNYTSESSNTHEQEVYVRIDIVTAKPKPKMWKIITKSIMTILDCRLLRSFTFTMFTISGAIHLAAFLLVFFYEQARCEQLGFSEQMSVYFVIALGGVNVFWRLVLGVLGIIPKIQYKILSISLITIGGIVTAVSGFSSNIYFQFAFCFIFGMAMASFAVFRMPLIMDLVGIEFFQNATGINLLFMGITCTAFPPIFGLIVEATKSYDLIFIINGCLIVISALCLIGMKNVDPEKVKNKKARCFW